MRPNEHARESVERHTNKSLHDLVRFYQNDKAFQQLSSSTDAPEIIMEELRSIKIDRDRRMLAAIKDNNYEVVIEIQQEALEKVSKIDIDGDGEKERAQRRKNTRETAVQHDEGNIIKVFLSTAASATGIFLTAMVPKVPNLLIPVAALPILNNLKNFFYPKIDAYLDTDHFRNKVSERAKQDYAVLKELKAANEQKRHPKILASTLSDLNTQHEKGLTTGLEEYNQLTDTIIPELNETIENLIKEKQDKEEELKTVDDEGREALQAAIAALKVSIATKREQLKQMNAKKLFLADLLADILARKSARITAYLMALTRSKPNEKPKEKPDLESVIKDDTKNGIIINFEKLLPEIQKIVLTTYHNQYYEVVEKLLKNGISPEEEKKLKKLQNTPSSEILPDQKKQLQELLYKQQLRNKLSEGVIFPLVDKQTLHKRTHGPASSVQQQEPQEEEEEEQELDPLDVLEAGIELPRPWSNFTGSQQQYSSVPTTEPRTVSDPTRSPSQRQRSR